MINQPLNIYQRSPRLAVFVIFAFLLAACGQSANSVDAKAPLLDTIFANGQHTCGLDIAGGVWCWGNNQSGQLGGGSGSDSARPVQAAGLSLGGRGVAAGVEHTCALTGTGGVKCWGRNDFGQLGSGASTGGTSPVDVEIPAGIARVITAGMSHTCVLNALGGVSCWGSNASGQLGVAGLDVSTSPVDVSGLGGANTALAAGWNHTCVLTAPGGVKCWGRNDFGQLGNGTTSDSATPVDVSGLGFGVKAISAGAEHSCALTAIGAVKCWGRNQSGQLGNGSNLDSAIPVDVSGLSAGVRFIAAGGEVSPGGGAHTCAVTVSGGVVCWGANQSGQLGSGTTSPSNTPVEVKDLSFGVRAIAAGSAHTCALTATGSTLCWGDNRFGQLGDGSHQSSPVPVNLK